MLKHSPQIQIPQRIWHGLVLKQRFTRLFASKLASDHDNSKIIKKHFVFTRISGYLSKRRRMRRRERNRDRDSEREERCRHTGQDRDREILDTHRVGQTGRRRNKVTAEGVPIFSLLIWVGSSLDTRRYWMTWFRRCRVCFFSFCVMGSGGMILSWNHHRQHDPVLKSPQSITSLLHDGVWRDDLVKQ